MELKSFAKINLGLKIHGKRADGFHLLTTVFETVSLYDTLVFKPSAALEVTCDDRSVPTDERNLILQAALRLRERYGCKEGVSIHLRKRVPSPGGLGGGSSNAAVALMGLSRLWRLPVGQGELYEIAKDLGSDVPFFLVGGRAIGCGRGDEIIPLADSPTKYVLITAPSFGIPTAEAFAALKRPFLTSDEAQSILRVCRSGLERDWATASETNDFEEWVFEKFPELAEMAERLRESGAKSAGLSGSGPSIFAIFEKEETRQANIEALKDFNWRMFAVATVTRAEYREALSECHGLFPISF
jgi:4-diphosphocytidyl-2-C-methyl-D-erythritol kinase